MTSAFEDLAEESYIRCNLEANDRLRVLRLKTKGVKKGTIILIPGFGSQISAWDEFLELKKEDYDLIVIETREIHTALLEEDKLFTADRYTADVPVVINSLEVENYIIVTSSMIASFVLRALSKKLINPKLSFFVGPVKDTTLPNWSWLFVYIAHPIVWKLVVKPFVKFYIKYFALDKNEKEQIKKYNDYLDQYDVRRARKSLIQLRKWEMTEEELKNIRSKCVLVGAETDKAHTSETTRWMASFIENSTYIDLGTNINAHSKPMVDLIEEILNKEKF